MSGPDRVQDTETKTMHELKEVQQRDSRIKISNLLCSIEAAEPPKSSSWEPSRTEAVHLESRSPQSPSRSPARSWQSTQHIQGEYAYRRHSEATRYSFEHFASNSSLRIPSNNNRDTQQYSTTLRPKAIEQDGPAYTRRASANVHDTRYPLDRRDSGLGRRDPEMRDAGYSPYERSYNSNGGDRVSHSTLGETKAQAPSSPLGYNAPRPAAVVQRPASLHADHYYQDNCHPYDTDTPRPRTDRSKSDFALHQQNYGPYSNASPPLVPAPLFQPKEPQQLSAPGTSHYHDHTTSPAMSHEPSYPSAYGPRRSVQSDVRRPSQGILLPEPYYSEARKPPARVYGLDAADLPPRPPLAPSASYGSKPLHGIPDGSEMDYSRRPSSSVQRSDSNYHASEPSPRYNHYSYNHTPHMTPDANGNQSRYQAEHVGSRGQFSGYGSQDRSSVSTPPASYTQPRTESSPYSPNMDPQPPTWYQQLAHNVPHKAPSRPSFSQSEPHAYAPPARRESDYGVMRTEMRNTDHWPTRASFSGGVPPLASPTNGNYHSSGHHLSKSMSQPGLSSHSIHPLDIPTDYPTGTTGSPTRPGKRHHEESTFVPEDGVKAKRKRANAEQLSVLNAAFERSYFPSTEERLRLSKQTKMCPRTVQIWFQNKRQSVKARTDAMDAAVAGRRRGSQAQTTGRKKSNDEGNGDQSTKQEQDTEQPEQQQRRAGLKRRNSGPLTPSDALMDSLQIQIDGRSVDYFSRKRRATIAQMEQSDR